MQILQFVKPSDIRTYDIDSNSEDQCRCLILQAILRNRSRDPLAALALLARARALAENIKQPDFLLDALLETARVYSWLGNLGEMQDCIVEVLARAQGKTLSHYRFLAFCRVADAYAESERWSKAKRYIVLAESESQSFENSVYWFQLQECVARVNLALDEDPSRNIVRLQNQDSNLSPYLQFRWRVLRFENALRLNDEAAQLYLQEIENLPICKGAESFEAVVVSVLRAKYNTAKGDANLAIVPLQKARDWYADEDLAVRLVDVRILLAKAFSAEGKLDAAAIELDVARSYCISRNLNLQLEKVETAFADLNLTLHPITETNRVTSANAWKNRQAYVILQKLGAGGQGEVYLAYDNARAKNVALKKLKVLPGQQSVQFAALEREVRGASAATAPGMARIFACGQESESAIYIVQEFVSGQSLRKYLEEGLPTLPHVIAVSETLKAMHQSGVVHGDVKPENVIVTPDGATMLVDFGLASLTNEKSKNLSGATLRYAPPLHASYFLDTAWRDRYAVGLMLLECLGAKLPENRTESWRNTLFVSQDLAQVIGKLPNSPAREVAVKLISPLSRQDLRSVINLK